MSSSDFETVATEQLLTAGTIQAVLSSIVLEASSAALSITAAGKCAVLRFTGVCDGSISATVNSDPQTVTFTARHPLLEHVAPKLQLFGQAPLPDPPRFFTSYYGYAEEVFLKRRAPTVYLNWPGNYRAWQSLVYNRTYLLATAPESVIRKMEELLDEQAAQYHTLPVEHSGRKGPPLYLAHWETGWLVFETASLSAQ